MISEGATSEFTWEIWWMVISGGMFFVGLIGRQFVVMIVGVNAITRRKEGDPTYSVIKEQIHAGWLANQPFKRMVGARALRTPLGNFFFYLLSIGLCTHVAFWVYAANFMDL